MAEPGLVASGPTNSLADMPGIRVGHHHRIDDGWLTGTTVILADAVAGVDVRGGGPGTRETDLLDPRNAVERVNAIVLTGGSAYGLAAAEGVMAELETAGTGFAVQGGVVPIVPAAVLYDLGRGGNFHHRPDAEFGRAACRNAGTGVTQGVVGAGTGAVSGGIKGGIGTASAVLADGTVVAALVAVNAAGSTVDPRTGRLYASLLPEDLPTDFDPSAPISPDVLNRLTQVPRVGGAGQATTIGVIATNATLTKAQCSKLAGVGHDGLARAINPVHTMFDGDTLFGLSTGTGTPLTPPELNVVLSAAGDVVTRAVGRAMLFAHSVTTPHGPITAYRELI